VSEGVWEEGQKRVCSFIAGRDREWYSANRKFPSVSPSVCPVLPNVSDQIGRLASPRSMRSSKRLIPRLRRCQSWFTPNRINSMGSRQICRSEPLSPLYRRGC